MFFSHIKIRSYQRYNDILENPTNYFNQNFLVSVNFIFFTHSIGFFFEPWNFKRLINAIKKTYLFSRIFLQIVTFILVIISFKVKASNLFNPTNSLISFIIKNIIMQINKYLENLILILCNFLSQLFWYQKPLK